MTLKKIQTKKSVIAQVVSADSITMLELLGQSGGIAIICLVAGVGNPNAKGEAPLST